MVLKNRDCLLNAHAQLFEHTGRSLIFFPGFALAIFFSFLKLMISTQWNPSEPERALEGRRRVSASSQLNMRVLSPISHTLNILDKGGFTFNLGPFF